MFKHLNLNASVLPSQDRLGQGLMTMLPIPFGCDVAML
jgi:hypothetical protein